MSIVKTLIAVKHTLVIRGLIYCVNQVLPDPEIEVVDIMYLLNNKDNTDKFVVIIEPELVSNPRQVTIDRIYKNYNQSKLVSLSSNELPLSLSTYFEENLFFNDHEDTLIEKLRCIYDFCDENSIKASGNSILSDREKEVLKAVALGYTNKEISSQLSISTHTVITHRKNITSKLGIKTIAGLTVYAVLNGIISSDEMSL